GSFEIKEILKENDSFNTLWIDSDFVNENGNFKINGARLVKDELGNSAKILDTQILVLPNDLNLTAKKILAPYSEDISGEMMIKVCENLIAKFSQTNPKKAQIFENLKQSLDPNQNYKGDDLKAKLSSKNDKTIANNELARISEGENYLLYSRSKDSGIIDELGGCVGAYYYKNGQNFCYSVSGVINKNNITKSCIKNSARIRIVKGANDEFMQSIIKLINVDFIRLGNITVYPFCFKYLDEYTKQNL
nr:hypothetical protein [Campylobacter sp.]